MIKRIISFLIIFGLISGICVISANADVSVNIPITVKERSGSALNNVLLHRGFALKQGVCSDAALLCLTDISGTGIPADFSVTERYADGSIKWGLVAFVCSLEANETKEYLISGSGVSAGINTPVTYTDEGKLLSNSLISLNVANNGISDIKWGSENIVSEFTIFADGLSFVKTDSELLKDNGIYKRLKLNGTVGNSFNAEIILTMWSGSRTVDVEYRFTAKENVTVSSMGARARLKNSVKSVTHPTPVYSSDSMLCSTYLDIEDSLDNKVAFVSYDNERFYGAVSDNNSTGFTAADNVICDMPLVNNTSFEWPDGMSRTFHYYITFDSAQEVNNSVRCAPYVTVSPQEMVNSGIINDFGDCGITDRIIQSVQYAMTKNNHCLEAGYIPSVIDEANNKIGASDMRQGENEFNIGMAQLSTGSGILYEAAMQSAESWADVVQYKGALSAVYGANRYRTDWTIYRSTLSHPYYGDSSGLYLTYVMSGNEYLGECFKAAVDHICTNMADGAQNMGCKFPHMIDWGSGNATSPSYVESRYIIQSRPLYFASQLYGDAKYSEALSNIIDWAKAAQSEQGFWYQAYYDAGGAYIHANQTMPAMKNYIFLYGTRALAFLSDKINSSAINEIIASEADFLCTEIDRFGAGLWQPTGDVTLYETNEDASRGKTPKSDIMAADILYHAYMLTENDKYLDALLDELRVWVCALGAGGLPTTLSLARGYGNGSVSSAEAAQNLTACELTGSLMKFFEDKRELVLQHGGEDLLIAFKKGSSAKCPETDCYYWYPELTQSVFENDNDAALFAMNVNGESSGYYTKKYYKDFDGGQLWKGMDNTVSPNGAVRVSKTLNVYEGCSAVKMPVYISDNTQSCNADVTAYSENGLSVNLSGTESVTLIVKDDIFRIENGKRYSYTKTTTEKGISLSICEDDNGRMIAAGDELKLNLSLDTDYANDTFAGVSTESFNDEENSAFSGGIIYDFPSNENKSRGSSSSIFYSFNAEKSGSVIISYDFYLPGGGGERRLMQIYDGAKTSNKRAAVVFAKSDGTLNINGNNFVTYFPENQWFNITLVADINAHTLDAYVDALLCLQNIPFYSGANADEIAIVETFGGGNLTYMDNCTVVSGFDSKTQANSVIQEMMNNKAYFNNTVDRYISGNDARVIKGMSISGITSNIIISDFPSAQNKSLKFTGGNGESWLWNTLNAPVTNNVLLMSGDFYFNSPVGARLFEAYEVQSNGNTRSVYIGTDTFSRFCINEGARSDFVYSTGKWYNVCAICDLDSKKYYVYINGVNVNEEGYNFFRSGEGVMTIKTTYNKAPERGDEMYLDNIYAEKFPTLEAAQYILKIRQGSKEGAFYENANGILEEYRSFYKKQTAMDALSDLFKAREETFSYKMLKATFKDASGKTEYLLPSTGQLNNVTTQTQSINENAQMIAVCYGAEEIKGVFISSLNDEKAVFNSELPQNTETVKFYIWDMEKLNALSDVMLLK